MFTTVQSLIFLMQIFHRHEISVATTFFLFLLFFANSADAEVRYDAHVITVSGKIDSLVYDDLSKIFANESVSTIVFKNSGGGSFFPALNIGKLISEKNVKTVVEGVCASACAIAFLGGDSREFSSEQADSALMFHPGFAQASQVPAQETKAIFFKWIESRTKHPPSPEFVAAMNKISNRRGGVYFLSPSHGIALKKGSSVFFCEGSEGNIGKCTTQSDSSAEKMHITSN
ncbi:hypothetical protein [Massilia sp. BJB1822]|uniref:hypothetical protein n=1 Tax=Massilia sp. BJB1822 TaxID=2744470 RepID=UPI001594A665|nr:hypothetical protein [Massilia sp. BJB1822]NVE00085.1 hypothetical protein [Massilia sp. BJB1822]